jgi:hypothetical protein
MCIFAYPRGVCVQFGLGFFWANGAGITKVIGTPVAAAQVVRALVGLGSEVYVGGKPDHRLRVLQ